MRLVKFDPNIYFVLWGGDPFMVPEIFTPIVKHLNTLKDVHYTICTNATKPLQPIIRK